MELLVLGCPNPSCKDPPICIAVVALNFLAIQTLLYGRSPFAFRTHCSSLPPWVSSGTAAFAPYPSALSKKQAETRRTEGTHISCTQYNMASMLRQGHNEGLKNIKDTSAFLSVFLLLQNDSFMFELLR